jgi:hypothetical protein
MTVLAALQVALATRLVAAPETSEPAASAGEDEMLTPEDAAIMLKQTRRWLSRNSKRLPFVKRISERSFVCSKQGILKWLASRRA